MTQSTGWTRAGWTPQGRGCRGRSPAAGGHTRKSGHPPGVADTPQLSGARVSRASLTRELSEARVSRTSLTRELSEARVSRASLTRELSGARVSRASLTRELSGARVSQASLTRVLSGAGLRKECGTVPQSIALVSATPGRRPLWRVVRRGRRGKVVLSKLVAGAAPPTRVPWKAVRRRGWGIPWHQQWLAGAWYRSGPPRRREPRHRPGHESWPGRKPRRVQVAPRGNTPRTE
jgi:hypothetical protein